MSMVTAGLRSPGNRLSQAARRLAARPRRSKEFPWLNALVCSAKRQLTGNLRIFVTPKAKNGFKPMTQLAILRQM
jgi:hypothetical protein